MQPRFLIASDLHLSAHTWSRHPELRGDAFFALRQIVDYALRERLPLLLLGDIFDSTRPDPETVTVWCQQMQRMEQAGLMVYYIIGNHDFTSVYWPSVHHWPTSIHEKSVIIARNMIVYGLNYTPPDKLPEALAKVPPGCILAAHQAWHDIQGGSRTDASFASIPVPVQMVLSGDYHICGMYDGPGFDGSRVQGLSPGSTNLRAWGEKTDKFAIVCELADTQAGEELRFHRVPLRVRQFLDLRADDETQLAQVLQQLGNTLWDPSLPEELQKPAVRVKYAEEIPEAYVRLIRTISTNFHFFPVADRTTEVIPVDMTSAASSLDDLAGAVATLAGEDVAARDLVLRLLKSADRNAEVQAWGKEFMELPCGSNA